MSFSKKNIVFSKLWQNIIKIILILSAPFFTILLSSNYEKGYLLIGAILSFLLVTIIIVKKVKINKINIYKFLISIYVAMFSVKAWLGYSLEETNVGLIKNIITKVSGIHLNSFYCLTLLGIFSVPFMVFLVYLFIDRCIPIIRKFFLSFTKCEKNYFKIALVFSIIVSTVLTYTTTAFSKPYAGDSVKGYDVIYTTDSGALTLGDAFFNVSFAENDIRQPLFGILSLPFSITAKIIGELLFFIPNNYGYEVVLTIFQFLLLAITTIMLGRLLKLEEAMKKHLFLLFSFSFPYILFSLLLEQYVIGLFYLILAIYYYFNNKDKTNYFYVGAVGALVTSGIMFPLITKFKSFKLWIKSAFSCLGLFFLILIIGGQFSQIIVGPGHFLNLTGSFAEKITLTDKLYQFTHFVKGIFISNKGMITEVFNHKSYQLVTFDSLSITGIIILVLCLISFTLNRKNTIAKLSFFWVIFSILLLFILGWGAVENGLVLYSLYFAWAYLILYFLLLKKLLKKEILFKAVIIISCVIMLIFNLREFIEILKFAIIYY